MSSRKHAHDDHRDPERDHHDAPTDDHAGPSLDHECYISTGVECMLTTESSPDVWMARRETCPNEEGPGARSGT